MRTRLCVVSASTHTRYVQLGVTDCARLGVTDCARSFAGNSIYCPRSDYNLCVTDGNAVAKYHMLLKVVWRRSVWITKD